MDFLTLAANRHSCRSFTGEPVSRWDIARCAEAARLAPSARNTQPWRIIVVDEQPLLEKVQKQTSDEALHLNTFTKGAPVLVAFVNEGIPYEPVNRGKMKGDNYTKSDIGGAILSFCLQAEELGLGTCIIGSFCADGVRELLGIPADKGLDLMVALGHPAPGEAKKLRRPAEDVLFYNGYPQDK